MSDPASGFSKDEVEGAWQKSQVLVEALPYIRRFRGKVVVIKYGGNAITDSSSGVDESLSSFAQDVVLMHSVGILPIVVHGGGPQIGDYLRRLGKSSEFVDGLRVTDAETLEIARMVLVGKVNPEIVTVINSLASIAVGLSGSDAGLIMASQHSNEHGFVGRVDSINPSILEKLLSQGLVPVIASIGVDNEGQSYNINADTVAGAIAGAIQAEKLIYLTNVEGIRMVANDSATFIRQIDADGLRTLIDSEVVSGGMIPKALSCLDAIASGAKSAHILDGTRDHALLVEIFTDKGVGTMIRSNDMGTFMKEVG
ncbi:MAG: acetylglutamate kinase [Acidimicrobiaceae bacterium]|nr:acetylglutamate kinase [Acidimicrobiaceae bacterium]